MPPKIPQPRNTYAQDYVIAAMAALLSTPIEIYTSYNDTTQLKQTFSPYPLDTSDEPFLSQPPPKISLWATHNHFLSLPHL